MLSSDPSLLGITTHSSKKFSPYSRAPVSSVDREAVDTPLLRKTVDPQRRDNLPSAAIIPDSLTWPIDQKTDSIRTQRRPTTLKLGRYLLIDDQRPEFERTLLSEGEVGILRLKTRYATDVDDLWSALTEPNRLIHWYGRFDGDFRVGGEFTAFVPSSGWDGHGRIDECVPRRRLCVTMWEEVGKEQNVAVEISAENDFAVLSLEKGGVAPDLLWAYGCGWQTHLEDLGAYLAGHENPDLSTSNKRFNELESVYRTMAVIPLHR